MQASSVRREDKFIINAQQYVSVRQFLKMYTRQDQYHEEAQFYRVHSLYFDDLDLSSFHDSTSGAEHRYKCRIRFYDTSASYCYLEAKQKKGSYVLKDRKKVPLPPRQLIEFINQERDLISYLGDLGIFDSEFAYRTHIHRMRPVLWVSYEREAFQPFLAGNVRVTIDTRVHFNQFVRDKDSGFWSQNLRPLPRENGTILEVKYSSYVPNWMGDMLEGLSSTRSSFSKYTQCLQSALETSEILFQNKSKWGI